MSTIDEADIQLIRQSYTDVSERMNDVIEEMFCKYGINNSELINIIVFNSNRIVNRYDDWLYVGSHHNDTIRNLSRKQHLMNLFVKLIEEYGVDIRISNENDNEYFLKEAVNILYDPLIKYLLEKGANPVRYVEQNPNCIEIFIQRNFLVGLKLFIEYGVTIDINQSKLLFGALEKDHEETLDFLLEYGVKINNQAFILAVVRNLVPTVKLLIDHGVNTNCQNGLALMLAICNRHCEITKLLLDHGAICVRRKIGPDNENLKLHQLLQDYGIDNDHIIELLCMKEEELDDLAD